MEDELVNIRYRVHNSDEEYQGEKEPYLAPSKLQWIASGGYPGAVDDDYSTVFPLSMGAAAANARFDSTSAIMVLEAVPRA